jgi:predicted ATPase/class 3 adenylate cyclase
VEIRTGVLKANHSISKEIGKAPKRIMTREKQTMERTVITVVPPEYPVTFTSDTLPTSDLPTGTVTFLFTDIEGSTSLWEHNPEAMPHAFARQEAIVREAMAAHGGYVYKMIGDAFQVAFSTASAALAAALEAQRDLYAEPWGEIGAIKVRMALHTGVTEERGDDYVGPDLNRVARLLSTGYGGQVLLSQATAELVYDHLPEGVALRDLGEHPLKDLGRPEHIYQAVTHDLPQDFPPLKTVAMRPYNLPASTTPFVGRAAELAQIETLLQDPQCRLISLVGIGGSGKTRLSIQAATQTQAFPQGVYFIELTATHTSEGIIAAIANALQMPFYVQPNASLSPDIAQAQLLRYLGNKAILLVLDNCEHLLSEAAVDFSALVANLLAAAPEIKLIATSRERLNLPDEWVLEISGLPFPSSEEEEEICQYAAVQLFIESARRSSAQAGTLGVAPHDWPAIARICQLLGGIPLGVEMAAAWTKILSYQEIVTELKRDLLSLIATWRTAPERHRSLRAVFDYSWHLLSDQEREVFCKLSVFRGRFCREAAGEVAGASLGLLGMLIDKSLLRRTPEGHFEIHPALRQYAAEKLACDPDRQSEARSQHAHYYSQWLTRMNEKLKGDEQFVALAMLRAETPNLHDAWQWLIEQGDLERLRHILPAMILFHEMHGRPVEAQEVVKLLRAMLHLLRRVLGDEVKVAKTSAIPLPGLSYTGLLALTLAALRHFSVAREPLEQTNRYQEESLRITQGLPDDQEKAFTLLLNSREKGILTPQQSLALIQQCIEIFKYLKDAWGTAMAQLILADIAHFGGIDTELARQTYQASLEGFTTLENNWGHALCLTGLADIKRREGHLEETYTLARQSLVIYEQMGDMWRVLLTRDTLSEIAKSTGQFDEARRYLKANLAYVSQIGYERQRDHYRERLQLLSQPQKSTQKKDRRIDP